MDAEQTQWSLQQGLTYRTGGNTLPFSVDADDGLDDAFLGIGGDTWTTINVANGQVYGSMEFRFEPDAQGRLPRYVGIVVTESLDIDAELEIGMYTEGLPDDFFDDGVFDPGSWEPNEFFGDTRSYRFFGLYLDTGIRRLILSNVRQVDHLQYGYSIPEPAGAVLLATALMLGLARRRR